MKHIISTSLPCAAMFLAVMQLTGCVDPYAQFQMNQQMAQAQQVQVYNPNDDITLLKERQNIAAAFAKNPDSDAWYQQRQKMAQAMGDRVFDKDFGRVYDSLVLAVSSLELKVNAMERTSGFIQASGIALPPEVANQTYKQAVTDWCEQNGFDAGVLVKQFSNPGFEVSLAQTGNSMSMTEHFAKAQRAVTFQLVKMGDNQTKVKLRFSDVYYPAEEEAYYKMVWAAVDKQIFVDKNIEGAVEERK